VGDILPLGNLVKRQARDLAQHLGIPKEIITKPPSPDYGLGKQMKRRWDLVMTILIVYINWTGIVKNGRRILDLKQRSEHKRKPAPRPDF